MADSSTKTEQPTAKKLKDGIKQGQVARSADVAAWTGLLALTFVLPLMVEQLTVQLEALLKTIPEIARQPSPQLLGDIALPAVVTMSLLLVPFFLVILVVTQISGWIQGGARPYLSRITPKGRNISPQQGAKRIFGTRGLWELAKQILKTSAIALVLWLVISRTVEIIFGSGLLPLSILASTTAAEGIRLVQIVIATGLLIAIADYFISRQRVRKQLMMSTQEVKEEFRQSEGDPLLRAIIRRRALDASRNRMMADVAFADAVLVNPTHVAVAIKYTKHLGAPRVVAKGAGVIAARIREIATENRVPLVEDIPLARTLYRSCEVGTEIPPELFTAVARVLAFVISLKRRGVHAGLHHAREVDHIIPV